MSAAVDTLMESLDLESLEENLFRGTSPQVGWQRVFGGQVIGQALVAAVRTVEDRAAHSLHGYFIRPGDPKVPIIYEVERYRDGRSFTTRRVIAIQHGRPIFTMAASFHTEEQSFDHQIDMPDVPAPEDLPSESEILATFPDTIPANMSAATSSASGRSNCAPPRPRDYARHTKAEPIQNVWIKASDSAVGRHLPSSMRSRLRLRHHAARHRAGRPWPVRVRSRRHARQPRPCLVVSPPVPRR